MKSVGIDIGSSSIKVIELNQTNKGLAAINFEEFPIGQNPAVDTKLEALEVLRSISTRYNSDQWQVVMGLRQDLVGVRNKIFPFTDRLKILKGLPFELEDDFPFSPETAVYDAKIIKTMGASSEVLACAVPSHRVAEAVGLSRDGGFDISILSCEGMAIANCLERWNEPPPAQPATQLQLDGEARPERRIELMVHIGHTRTLVCAFEDNTLVGLRSILWGGKNVAEAIAKKYELSYSESLKIAQSRAFILLNQDGAAYDQILFSQTISESVRELTRDIQMTLLEFQSEFNGQAFNILLSGGCSAIQNINAFMTQQLEIPTNPGRVLDGRIPALFQITPQIEAVCAVALGLAIEGLKKPRNPPINFLKGAFQKQNRKLQQLWHQWGDLSKIAAAAFAIFLVYAFVRENITDSLVERAAESLKTNARAIAHLPAKQANEAGVQKFIKEQRKRTQDMKSLQALIKMNSALDILRKISDAVPTKATASMNVGHLSIKDDRVEITGFVTRAQEATAIQQSLQTLSVSGKTDAIPAGILGKTATLNVPFAYGFNVDRGLTAAKE